MKTMDSTKDFSSCLETLEAREDQTFTLVAGVTMALFDEKRVFCVPRYGDMCLLTLGSDTIAKVENSDKRGPITCVAWAGKDKCVSGNRDGPSRLWDLAQCKLSAVLDAGDRQDRESDYAVAVTSDNRAVFGSNTGNLRLWDLDRVLLVAKVKAHDAIISRISFAGDKCVSGAYNGALKVWNTAALQELATLPGTTKPITALEVIGSDQILSGSADGTVRSWDLSEYKEAARYIGHKFPISYLKVVDSDCAVSCGKDDESNGEIRVWSLKDYSDIYQCPLVGMRCFELQKEVLYCGTKSGLVLLNLRTKQVVATINLSLEIILVHYFDGKCICFPKDETIRIVEVGQYQQMHELRGHTQHIFGMLLWGSEKLVSWSIDEAVRVWDVVNYRELGTLQGTPEAMCCAALTVDNKVISGGDMAAQMWNLQEMKEIPHSMRHPNGVQRVAVTTDSKAVCVDFQGNVYVWNLENCTKVGEIQGNIDWVTCLVLVSDRVAITGSNKCSLRVLNVAECTVLATLDGHQKTVKEIALASGNRCVSASEDKTVRVWDLQVYTQLAALQGHRDQVNTVAVAGEKCVSGSNDCAVIVWSLSTYLQEARFECISQIWKIVWVNSGQFASGHRDGEVKVWSDCREIASLKGHSGSILSLLRVDDHKLASIGEQDMTIKVWDLTEISNCLAQCSNWETLEREISEGKSVLPQCRSRIPDFRDGKRVPRPESSALFRPYFFNALHFCAYYNYPALLNEYLQEGVPLVRGVFGSPLTLALGRNTYECVDIILDYLIAAASNQYAWKDFQTINDDLPALLTCGISKLEDFFGALLQRPVQKLPIFITPVVPLPLTKFVAHPYISEFEILANFPGARGEEVVKFSMSLVNWNFTAGSTTSLDLLQAAVNCPEKRVLLTEFFRTVIEQKWASCFPFTFSVATAYAATLYCLLETISTESPSFCIGYLALNGLFALYEVVQVIAMKASYFSEGWNVMDIVRCALSISWASFKLAGFRIEKYFTLAVILLDFIRGFTHFRSFRTTRIFVYMTFTVVAEVYSFLIILAYSVFAFGIFAAVLAGEQSLWETWKKAYSMAMGNFDTTGYSVLEWTVFTGATVTNVVIMMNLLISILGEAYEKAQMTMLENDLHMQASLLLEYETLMVWRRGAESNTWIVTCRKGDKGEQLEWAGKVVKIVTALTSELSRVETEIAGKVAGVDAKLQAIDDIRARVTGVESNTSKMAGVGEKTADLEALKSQMSAVEEIRKKMREVEDLKKTVLAIEEKFTSVEEIKAKVVGLEEKLDAVISYIKARS